MQYWINHNGVQTGPVDLDALKQMGLTSSAYVWHEGLSDWVSITQVPELQGLYGLNVNVATPAPEQEPAPAVPAEPVEADASPKPVAQKEEAVQGQPYQPQPQPQPQMQQPQYQPQYAGEQPAATEPCPPTNLVWAIITTVLCCIPPGIVAIIYATKVSSKYRAGDIEGAKRASEIGAWWCIAAIILGIICQPFISWLQVMTLVD